MSEELREGGREGGREGRREGGSDRRETGREKDQAILTFSMRSPVLSLPLLAAAPFAVTCQQTPHHRNGKTNCNAILNNFFSPPNTNKDDADTSLTMSIKMPGLSP